MASIHKEKRGGKTYYRLQFYDKNNRRRTMRLGTINRRAADTIRVRIEDLLSASFSGGSPNPETARWLAELGDDLGAKLTTAGFGAYVPERQSAMLGAFLESYIDTRKAGYAPNTLRNLNNTKRALTEFFGEQRDLRSISEGDADDWRHQLAEKYADATLNKHIKRARQFYKSAIRKGFAERNPFSEVKGGSEQNESRLHFIDVDTTDKVLKACPDVEWRVIVALARFGGVRTPSESLGLRWTDIDWANDRFTVTSPKTKKQGKPYRVVPLFPELRKELADAFEQAEDGAEFVITRYRDRNANLRTQFERILKRAGVEQWPKLFQNLRASRETELTNSFPLHVVTGWLGNTPAVANKHYLQTTDEHFRQAVIEAPKEAETGGATVGAIDDEKVVQLPVLTASGDGCQELPELHHPLTKNAENVVFPSVFGDCAVPPRGNEHYRRNPGNTQDSRRGWGDRWGHRQRFARVASHHRRLARSIGRDTRRHSRHARGRLAHLTKLRSAELDC